MPEAISAIGSADLITLGPGSLFTSLLPPLLVRGVADAVANSLATKVFIGNMMTQPGETDGFSILKHLEVIKAAAPQIDFDHILLNCREISPMQREKYESEGSSQIGVGEIERSGMHLA